MELGKKRGRPSNAEIAARLAMKEATLAEFQELALLKPEVGPFESALGPFVEDKQMEMFKQLARKTGMDFEKFLLRALKSALGVF